MYKSYILLKSIENILSPELRDFFKGLLGTNIEIKNNSNNIYIYHNYENKDDIKDALTSLAEEYDGALYAYISRDGYNDEIQSVLDEYFLYERLKKNVYDEHELIMELILSGKHFLLDKVVFGKYLNDQSMKYTLLSFLEHNMNTSKTADAIYMHRNTLINKLERFTEITGYDPKKFVDGFIIYYLLKK